MAAAKKDNEVKKLPFLMRRFKISEEVNASLTKSVSGGIEGNTFNYSDLASIKKVLDPLKEKYGIMDICNFKKYPQDQPTIELYDMFDESSVEPKLIFYMPIVASFDNDPYMKPIQQVGSYTTYYRRYMLSIAYDIVAKDEIDSPMTEIPVAEDINIPSSIPEIPEIEAVIPEVPEVLESMVNTVEKPMGNPTESSFEQTSFLDGLNGLISESNEEKETKKEVIETKKPETKDEQEFIFSFGPCEQMTLQSAICVNPQYLNDIVNGKTTVDEYTFEKVKEFLANNQ